MWHVEETTAFDLNNGWVSFWGVQGGQDGGCDRADSLHTERWLLWGTKPAIDELTPAAPGRFQSKVVSMRATWSGGLQGLKPARAVGDDKSHGAVGRLNQEWMSPFPTHVLKKKKAQA